jgi:hypothetical protein
LYNKVLLSNCNFIESIIKNKICIITLDKFINITNNKYNLKSLKNIIFYNNNDNFFYNLNNDIRLRLDNNTGFFRYFNINDYPTFIYSLKYNPIIDDMLNIIKFRGNIINSIIPTTPITLYSNHKLLILIYIDEKIYKMRNDLEWINKYRTNFILPSIIESIDIVIYTMNNNIYNLLRNNNKNEVYLIKDYKEFFINILN